MTLFNVPSQVEIITNEGMPPHVWVANPTFGGGNAPLLPTDVDCVVSEIFIPPTSSGVLIIEANPNRLFLMIQNHTTGISMPLILNSSNGSNGAIFYLNQYGSFVIDTTSCPYFDAVSMASNESFTDSPIMGTYLEISKVV